MAGPSGDWFQTNLYNKMIAGQLRDIDETDVGEDLKQFIDLISITFDELNDNVYTFSEILDIDKCPAKYLPYLGHYIGWYFGPSDSESEQRSQLKFAVDFYKKKGIEESFRILAYSYGFFIDVIPLWSSDYQLFRPTVQEQLTWVNDTPPVAELHPAFGGTGELYPTPHIGIDITAFVGFPSANQFNYMSERVHDIRPAHVVLDWIRYFVSCTDRIDFYDESGSEITIGFPEPINWPGCFDRSKCNVPYYRDGTITNRQGPGGFYPIQDYTSVYPPSDPTVPFSDPTVNLEPGISVMPSNPPYDRLHLRVWDTWCTAPTRDSFDYDVAYHLRDGSSWMRRNRGGYFPLQDYSSIYPPSNPLDSFSDPGVDMTPNTLYPLPIHPVRDHFFRDGQLLEKCSGTNIPWMGPIPWQSEWSALTDVPHIETPPWVHLPPSGNAPIVNITSTFPTTNVESRMTVVHDFDSNNFDMEGWEIKATDHPVGQVNLDRGYTFDIDVTVNDSPSVFSTLGDSIPIKVKLVGSFNNSTQFRLFEIDIFKEGFRLSSDATKNVSWDFTKRTLFRVIILRGLVIVHCNGQRVLYDNSGVWLLPTSDTQVVRVEFGPLLSAGHTSSSDIEWIRLLGDGTYFGPGRDYMTEFTSKTWEGWCCPPEPPDPGSPLRWYCCKEDYIKIIANDNLAEIELGAPFIYV